MSIRGLGLAMVGFALASVSLAAHHSFAMFEMDKDVEYQGVVSEWKWQNPHVHFILDVKAAPGVDPGPGWPVGRGGRLGQHHDPAGVEPGQLQGWRSGQIGRASDEGRIEGHFVVLCDPP